MTKKYKIKKIFGPPGTGKTTALIGEVKNYLDAGYDIEHICYAAFTRKANQQALAKLKNIISPSKAIWFRTLHAIAYRCLSLEPDDILSTEKDREHFMLNQRKSIRRSHWNIIGEQLGYEFDSEEQTYSFISTTRRSVADRMRDMYNLARARAMYPRQIWDENSNDVDWYEFESFCKFVNKYKNKHRLYDFSDIIIRFNEIRPILDDIRVLIIDEAQDLTPAQWNMVGHLASGPNMEQLIMAGDDDQAIYEWAGADVDCFLNYRADETIVLGQSYRVPIQIQNIALDVISGVHNRQIKQWEPRADPGDVMRVFSINDVIIDPNEKTLFLARERRTVTSLVTALNDMGYDPDYKIKRKDIKEIYRAIQAWNSYNKKLFLKGEELNLIRQFVENDDWLEQVDPNKKYIGLEISAIVGFHPSHASWDQVFTNIPLAIYDIIRTEGVDTPLKNYNREPKIIVDTIHQSKGDEADHVVLCNRISKKLYLAQEDNEDYERRVWYVGLTRAKKRLTILAVPRSIYFYDKIEIPE